MHNIKHVIRHDNKGKIKKMNYYFGNTIFDFVLERNYHLLNDYLYSRNEYQNLAITYNLQTSCER